jgi:threonine efflux protein
MPPVTAIVAPAEEDQRAVSYGATLAGIAFANMLGILSPGPAFLLVSRTAAARSRSAGLATGLGVAMAATLWAAAATFGVAFVMTRLAAVYGAIQLAGAVYLIWLGLSAWLHQPAETAAGSTSPSSRRGSAILTGFGLSLTNPKIVVFFSSIFVALIPAEAPLWVRLAALGIVAGQETLWAVAVACLFSQPSIQAGYRRFARRIEQVMGAVFIALGARIAALARV